MTPPTVEEIKAAADTMWHHGCESSTSRLYDIAKVILEQAFEGRASAASAKADADNALWYETAGLI
jgi:hypothetical protein